MKKKYWIVLLAIAVIAYFGYNYIFQDHRNIETETVAYTVKSNDLLSAFQQNLTTAETKFLNKTLIVTGDASEINTADLTLDDAIVELWGRKQNDTNANFTNINHQTLGWLKHNVDWVLAIGADKNLVELIITIRRFGPHGLTAKLTRL